MQYVSVMILTLLKDWAGSATAWHYSVALSYTNTTHINKSTNHGRVVVALMIDNKIVY